MRQAFSVYLRVYLVCLCVTPLHCLEGKVTKRGIAECRDTEITEAH
jgi:hypothetical protein